MAVRNATSKANVDVCGVASNVDYNQQITVCYK
jgi:hypothetical protein